jgi:hypothetical protein
MKSREGQDSPESLQEQLVGSCKWGKGNWGFRKMTGISLLAEKLLAAARSWIK